MNGSDAGGEMTLAFSLSAVDRLADPAAALAEARDWSLFVGVVDGDAAAVEETVAAESLPQDFELDPDEDVWLAMERIRGLTGSPRHVYVGASEEERRIATQLGWEYVHVSEAAEKADWELDDESGSDLLARFRESIADLFGS